MARKKKKRYSPYRYHTIGKYIDTPTKTELDVVYFVGDIGDFKISGLGLPEMVVKGCRFQIKLSAIKRKKKFEKLLNSHLTVATGWREKVLSGPTSSVQVPLLFGLLKLRKGKQRKFVLVQAADIYYKSKVVHITAVVIDNLLYLDLANKIKNNA